MNWRRHQPVASPKGLALATSAALMHIEASHADPTRLVVATWQILGARHDWPGCRIGAGWARASKGGREFVGLKLDDPSFPAPIHANLIGRDGQHELIWFR